MGVQAAEKWHHSRLESFVGQLSKHVLMGLGHRCHPRTKGFCRQDRILSQKSRKADPLAQSKRLKSDTIVALSPASDNFQSICKVCSFPGIVAFASVAMKKLKGRDGSPRGNRFHGLFGAPPGTSRGQASQIHGAGDRDVTPVVHSATTALYIRNFIRPPHPNTLKEYLVSLGELGPSRAK